MGVFTKTTTAPLSGRHLTSDVLSTTEITAVNNRSVLVDIDKQVFHKKGLGELINELMDLQKAMETK